jgi:hypothetical protein
MRRFSIALLGIAACGGDDGTGPTSIDVTGTWSATVSNMTGGGTSCSSTVPTPVVLNQAGTSISGSYSGGEVFCSGPGGPGSIPLGSGLVINGTLSGRTITFDLDTPDFHHTGTANTTSMAGTAQWTIDFGIPVGEITLSGNWAASKQ